jgi:hypothetical protein
MQEVMTSFGKNGSRVSGVSGDYDQSEHGVGLKLACFRLGKTAVILSRSK